VCIGPGFRPMLPAMKNGILAVLLAGFAASCAGPLSPGGSGPDKWGHRPGPQGFHTVILDAGHGGKDPGAVSRTTGAKEKDLALDTAKRLRRQLGGRVKVKLMRSGDEFIELDDRAARASGKGGTILVSLHYNSGGSGIRGPETYYWRVDSHGLATRIQRAMKGVSPAESGNRGLVRRRLRLTRNPDIPCVLVEFGYLSHPAEARLCSDPAYRDKMAAAVARAILDQQAKGDAGTGPLPRPIYAPPSRPTDPPGS
jgi:N-acetylmuramoyl-L-alanine amidase